MCVHCTHTTQAFTEFNSFFEAQRDLEQPEELEKFDLEVLKPAHTVASLEAANQRPADTAVLHTRAVSLQQASAQQAQTQRTHTLNTQHAHTQHCTCM